MLGRFDDWHVDELVIARGNTDYNNRLRFAPDPGNLAKRNRVNSEEDGR